MIGIKNQFGLLTPSFHEWKMCFTFKGKPWMVPYSNSSNSHDYGRISLEDSQRGKPRLWQNMYINDPFELFLFKKDVHVLDWKVFRRVTLLTTNKKIFPWRGADEWPCHWIVENIWPQKCWKLCWNLAPKWWIPEVWSMDLNELFLYKMRFVSTNSVFFLGRYTKFGNGW